MTKSEGSTKSRLDRLIELVNATRALAGFRLQYNWKFALRPEAVTWKEFNELLMHWKQTPVPDTISASRVTKQSEANSIGTADVEAGLFETMLNAKHNAASKAAESIHRRTKRGRVYRR